VLVESQRGHGSCSCSGGGAPGLWAVLGGLRCSLESEGIWVDLRFVFCGFCFVFESCGCGCEW